MNKLNKYNNRGLHEILIIYINIVLLLFYYLYNLNIDVFVLLIRIYKFIKFFALSITNTIILLYILMFYRC